MRGLWDQIAILCCRTFHSKTTLPVQGCYRCLTCLRTYPVPWFEGEKFIRRDISSEKDTRTAFVVPELQKSRG
jgi:hypothetical protein